MVKSLIPTQCNAQICCVIHQGTHSMYNLRKTMHKNIEYKRIGAFVIYLGWYNYSSYQVA